MRKIRAVVNATASVKLFATLNLYNDGDVELEEILEVIDVYDLDDIDFDLEKN